jgi:hypothetical protein
MALHIASRVGRVEAMRALVELGADVNQGDVGHLTIFVMHFWVVWTTLYVSACEWMHGAHVHQRESGTRTEVEPRSEFFAILDGKCCVQCSVVLYIISPARESHRFCCACFQRDGSTPLLVASSTHGWTDVIDALVELGADVNQAAVRILRRQSSHVFFVGRSAVGNKLVIGESVRCGMRARWMEQPLSTPHVGVVEFVQWRLWDSSVLRLTSPR